MAMTLVELQAFIDSKPDTRNIVNEIADYLQANPGGGGGNTLYTADDAIVSDRTVDLNGKILRFDEGGEAMLMLDPTVNSEGVAIFANNTTGGNNFGGFSGGTTATQGVFSTQAAFNSGAKIAQIDGAANTTTATLGYTADTHTFAGKIINPNIVASDFANDGAAAIGGIGVGEFYHTAGTVKVRLA